MNFEIYLVGGAVRDEILGNEPNDLDFLVLAPTFLDMQEMLFKQGAKIFVSKPEFLTIRCSHPNFGIADFACGRKESDYTDKRHPDKVIITTDLKEDLSRRDFTIGAMAKNMDTGILFDPFNGQQDIKDRIIRCVGDPHIRFKEDMLRVLRAIRFAVQKNFAIHPTVKIAINSCIPDDFSSVSTERIREELFKMFSVNSWQSAFYIFQEYLVIAKLMKERGIWLEPTFKKL